VKSSIAFGIVAAAALALGQNVSQSDREFMENAARGGLFEVEMGKIAVNRAQDPQVVSFAQRMIADHTEVNDSLKQLASAKGITLPTQVSAEQKKEMDRVSALSGPQFDRAYMMLMVNDHENDLREFARAAQSANDPDLRQFAANTAPILDEHLEEARKISESLRQPPSTGSI
jgi:putative membrane protein